MIQVKNNQSLFLLLVLGLFIASCTSASKEEATTEEEPTTTREENQTIEITGFQSIEELAASVVASLKSKDYDDYYSHIMTEEMEKAQAERITDSTVRQEFLHEYGFSLHEEKEYFNNLVNYYDSKNIDLGKAVLADMEFVEYKGGEYEPIMLYEVFVPIEMDYELLIDFTVIEVDGSYFLTSEIGI